MQTFLPPSDSGDIWGEGGFEVCERNLGSLGATAMRRYHSLYFSLRLVKNSTTVEVLPKHTCTVAQLLWGGASASLAAFPNLVTPCNIEISSAVILVQNRCCCAIKGSPLQYHGKYNKASSHVKKKYLWSKSNAKNYSVMVYKTIVRTNLHIVSPRCPCNHPGDAPRLRSWTCDGAPGRSTVGRGKAACRIAGLSSHWGPDVGPYLWCGNEKATVPMINLPRE